ncbi:hypothetical protein SORA22_12320 [Streptococcus oralis]|uniref:hypothetical protein n=1 Tax=Streptococcus oralis TaxID=1303 RepID=UPI00398BBCE4|nr:hypothetical protein OlisA3_0045 [Streptococcus phage OlisA3]
MGTLFDQKPRVENIDFPGERIVLHARNLCEVYSFLTFEQALQCIELDFKIDNYDVMDEQLAGFGELLGRYMDTIND